jgi:septin family protein
MLFSVENEAHCDFVKLREMLLSTNMINLIDITHTKHYQLFRANRLREIGFKDDDEEDLLDSKSSNTSINRYSSSKSIMDVYNIKRAEMYEEIQRREQEIKEEFVQKVKEKESELRECEKEVKLQTKTNTSSYCL